MALEEIKNLKEKIEKDPSSKLFVPLAEEYKKAGMYDEAIEVLTKGIEKQPGYLSARVSLGKIYSERGLRNEARAEFEKVIETIPDNLFAHKKLAEIYKDLGEKDMAIREFKAVLRLNPIDEWATAGLAEIQEEVEALPQKTVEEKAAGGARAGEQPQEEKVAEELAGISYEEKGTDLPEDQIKPIEELEDSGDEERPSEEDRKLWKAHAETLKEAAAVGEEAVIEAEELSDEESASLEKAFEKAGAAIEQTEQAVKEVSTQPVLTMEDADQYILEGKYSEAINIYRNLLSAEPDNRQVLQRTEELRALLKMLGKDKEQLISRLESFLEGIRKRRDEFFGST